MKSQLENKDREINSLRIQIAKNEQKIKELEALNQKYIHDYEFMYSTSKNYSNALENLQDSKIALYTTLSPLFATADDNRLETSENLVRQQKSDSDVKINIDNHTSLSEDENLENQKIEEIDFPIKDFEKFEQPEHEMSYQRCSWNCY
ncbi:uncharacterized protein LOC115231873 [Octopus sinensis]|uniref:Uncharacterized protein LOC115229599 n=1 Tax=Octopus sinensis TaxID=2607531 RepID=A0A6P7U8D3_9MOLL|nr:uncharacterized protein LOC115229599 [Octopus sinensis]XP_029657642.1 uncharacterized protein LOC115231869 [Octopus sinensis]XP_029657647.1 uncharacterized protein LOC115231873 [Octopus sinensis]